jgi:hypothetical protein
MEVRGVSVEPPPSASFFSANFLCSEECCDIAFDFMENLESSEVFPVDSTRGAVDDLPVLETLVDWESSGAITESSAIFSRERIFGLFLNWVRCTTVGLELSNAAESFLAVLVGIGGIVDMRFTPLGVWLRERVSTIDEPEAKVLIHSSEQRRSECGGSCTYHSWSPCARRVGILSRGVALWRVCIQLLEKREEW